MYGHRFRPLHRDSFSQAIPWLLSVPQQCRAIRWRTPRWHCSSASLWAPGRLLWSHLFQDKGEVIEKTALDTVFFVCLCVCVHVWCKIPPTLKNILYVCWTGLWTGQAFTEHTRTLNISPTTWQRFPEIIIYLATYRLVTQPDDTYWWAVCILYAEEPKKQIEIAIQICVLH